MATIDDRVVAMSFENDKFNSGVESTVGVLGRLKQALNLSGAASGLQEIDAAGQKVDLSHIGQAIEGITGSFSVLGGAAAVVLGNIATKAIEVGSQVANSFTFAPVAQGFRDYETQINAVQTIMANTGLSGAAGLGQINAVLKDMQNYANLTVYNFADMAKNIGTFTAAGVDLKTAQESIKGIANLAALSGSSSEQASGAMYQLSQAIAAGKVQLQDWNSVVNAGIGGKVFQEALFNTAKAMGTLKDVPLGESFDQWKAKGNSFRQSLQQNQSQVAGSTSAIDKLAQAHKDAAKTIEDAQKAAADSVANAAQRVKDAQRSVGDAARSAAQAVSGAVDSVRSAQQASADAVRQAAKDIANAMQGVQQAQVALASTNRQAAKDIANAVQQEHATIAQSSQNVITALDAVTAARQKLVDAMKPPSVDELQAAQDKLQTAQLDQADLADAVTKAQQEQTRATQDLAIAQDNLAKLQSSGTATPDQIIMAQRAVQDAQQKVTDLTDAQTRALLQQHAATRSVDQAQQDLQATQQKGTSADKNVQTAQDALTKALQAYHDAQIKSSHDIAAAEQNVRDVKIKSAQSQVQAEQNVTKAEQNLSDVRIRSSENEQKAQDAVVKAEQNLTNVRITSAESQQKAAESLAQAEKDQAKAAIAAQDSVAKAHEQAAKSIQAAEASLAPKKGGRGQDTWLTSDVLTQTLKQFSGDMSTAQLKAQGFTDAQIAHIESMGKTAVNAATQVKTFSQLMQSLKEEVATAWSTVFKTIFGGLDQAKGLFSPLHTTIENLLTNPIYALNNVLKDWANAGGRTALIDALKTGWQDLAKILHVVREAWDNVFPPTTGNQLADMTKSFDEFMHRLTPSAKTLDEIKRTFQGLFAVLDIGKTIVMAAFRIFADLFGIVTPAAGGGFLALTAHLGDFLVKVDDAIKKGTFLKDVVHNLGQVLHDPASLFEKLGVILPPLSKISDELQKAWDKLTGSMGKASSAVGPLASGLGALFHSIITFLTQGIQNLNFDQVLHVVDVGLLGGIYLLFKRFFSGAKITDLLGGGVLGSVKEVFEGLTGSLGAMQQKIKSQALVQIAIAVGLLAASMVALSMIPANKLNTALSGLTLAMGELVGAMAILNKIGSGAIGAIRLGALAGGLILLAGAVDLLVLAVRAMSGLSWAQLEKGLVGVGALLFALSQTVELISANSAGMITAGLGIIAIAAGIRIMAGAVRDFSGMSWEGLAKGLSAVAVTLVSVGLAARLFPSGMIAIGLGLIGVAEGLKLLSDSVIRLGGLDIRTIVVGLGAIAATLGLLALAMESMPPGMVAQAAGLLLISLALRSLASSMQRLGEMSGTEIVKGLFAMGGALAILAVALGAMEGALGGAAALAVAAASLDLLTPAIKVLGDMSVGDIIKSLVAMAGAFTVLGLAGLVLAPVAPALLALGVALLAIGGGLALAGAGIALVGVGLGAIAVSGPIAVAAIVRAITNFVEAVPKLAANVVTALVSVVNALSKAAPEFATALGKILVALGDAIILAAPRLVLAFDALVQGGLKAIRDNFPTLVQTGLEMLQALLKGIEDNIGGVVRHAVDVVTTFLNTLADNLPRIVSSGAKLLSSFLTGIADNIGHVVTAAINIVTHYINGVANNIGRVVNAGANLIAKFIAAIVNGETRMLNAGINIVVKFITGVINTSGRVVTSAINLISKFITEVANASLNLVDKGAEAVIHFLNGVAGAIRKYSPQLWNAGWNIATAMIDGMWQGLTNLASKIVNKVGDIISSLPDKALHILGIKSPSTVFYDIGQNTIQGLFNGLTSGSDAPINAIESMTNRMVKTMGVLPAALNDLVDFQSPVITPVVDLSKVHEGAALIPGILSNQLPVQPAPFLLAAAGSGDNAPQDTSGNAPPTGQGIMFQQNNYSPKALSDVEIYRATKNQIAQLAGSTLQSDASYFAKAGK